MYSAIGLARLFLVWTVDLFRKVSQRLRILEALGDVGIDGLYIGLGGRNGLYQLLRRNAGS